MRVLTAMVLAALTIPAAAVSQVGPNPAVSGGSQDPTIGPSTDSATAPEDVATGTNATGAPIRIQTDGDVTSPAADAADSATTAAAPDRPTRLKTPPRR